MLGPTRHQFDIGLSELSADEAYREKLRQRFREMQAARVPVIFSLMHLAVLSGVKWARLRSIVERKCLKDDYHVYPKPKASGGNRWICVPAVELRAVQTWITTNILNSRTAFDRLHEASHAYGKGCSILENAKQHAGAPWIVKVDIHNFFESISERQIYRVFRLFEYPALLSFEMARICTRVAPPAVDRFRTRDVKRRWNEANRGLLERVPYSASQSGHLPQGAPSSPMLSNLVMVDLDKRVSEIVEAAGGVYTRYADDLVVSFSQGSRPQCEAVLKAIRRALGAFGFTINKKKSHVLPPGARKVVTGLVVNSQNPRLKRQTRNHIEVALHYIETKGLLEQVQFVGSKHPISYLNHLSGLIEFARSIEPDFGNNAASRLATICKKNAIVLDTLNDFSAGQDFVISHRGRSF
jgi:RNA-directed DNA polymerase